jgi:hypothetical protein
MHALFVTSFAPDMFRTTGVHLLTSFVNSGTPGQMLVCHEGSLAAAIAQRWPTLLQYDLAESAFLRSWLHDHRDIIPDYLGGQAVSCDCTPDPEAGVMAPHKPRCVFDWYNRNASRWFRKIVALDHAMSLDSGDCIVWLDADCRFTSTLPPAMLDEVFGDHAAFYLRGPDRRVIESGVIGFRRDAAGLDLLTRSIERYRSGRFREDARWDDGYQFQMMFDETPTIPAIDIAGPATNFDYVLPGSPLGPFLAHFKGVHGHVLRVMR